MTEIAGIAGDKLKSFVERVERLEAEKADLAEDIKEVFQEAKSVGFDVKAIRQVIKERKIEASQRQEQLSMFELYWDAVHG